MNNILVEWLAVDHHVPDKNALKELLGHQLLTKLWVDQSDFILLVVGVSGTHLRTHLRTHSRTHLIWIGEELVLLDVLALVDNLLLVIF